MFGNTVIKVVTSPNDTATQVVAAVGLGLALVSLAWQAAQYLLGGPRLKITLLWGYWNGAMLLSAEIDNPSQQNLAAQGYGTRLIGVSVTNRGRMAISIEQAMADTECKVSVGNPGEPYNPELHFRVEPHSSQTWWIDLAAIEAAMRAWAQTQDPSWANRAQKVWVRVTRGDGKTMRSRRWARVGP